jgi:phage-related tail fiber protein
VGAIPLPSLGGGVAVRDVGIVEQTGYLIANGDIR